MASEDLATSLQSYQIQLQQVEAALTTEPENDELLKLQRDLQEVINLTSDLLTASNTSSSATVVLVKKEEGGSSSSIKDEVPLVFKSQWKNGDRCLAVWSQDKEYYEATIDDITEDGHCTVTFQQYGNTDVTTLSQLRQPIKATSEFQEGGPSMSKKQIVQAQREYKKKKAQKKVQRMKLMEEEREQEKVKWHSFNTKAFNKNKKGHVKKSIFASPDNVNGRVGVGTCGIGGRPMTEFQHQEKWKRQMATPRTPTPFNE